jgi:ABC-type nickel/cobalt efflux system permease component RcnA
VKSINRWLAAIIAYFIFLPIAPASAHPELVFYIDTSATVQSSGNQLYLDYFIAKSDQIAFADLATVESDLNKYSRNECSNVVERFQLTSQGFEIKFELQSASAIEELPSTGAGVWVWCRFLSPIEFYDLVPFNWEDSNFFEVPGYREFNVGSGTSKSIDLTNYESVLDLQREVSTEFEIEFPIEEIEIIEEQEPLVEPKEPKEPKVEPTPAPSISPEPVLPKFVTETPIEKSWITKLSDRYFRSINPTPLTVLFGMLFALILGARHSIAPGHGKSIMAVLALAERGQRREIYRLGLTMGATHTFGVFILGSLLIVSSNLVPSSIIPILGIISGSLIVAIGLFYIRKFIRHEKLHRVEDQHHHHDHSISGSRIALLGVVGGMVPTPTALTVMVGSAALGSAWYGVLLVVSYGVGMTLVLILAGRVLERAYRYVEGVAESKSSAAKLLKIVPVGAATLQVLAGSFLVLLSYGALR